MVVGMALHTPTAAVAAAVAADNAGMPQQHLSSPRGYSAESPNERNASSPSLGIP